ncbi:hypothetical protein BK744_09630 [Bacillus thuringiensis serovar zhaodongensis]|uniref:DUF2971 domain-containing protein n=1 Tax=Bacillus cereus group TaxID=86661 RepID=UPI000A375F22|nr:MULTISPECIES: DUF2971 domain-containing protein [Bacillus cereus group]OUB76774.1 hypothetical protein BK744_09630 [Bacillus thuringiensis serovar zhaodongensis]GIX59425.1 hypothetical protein BPADB04_44550 [Bacillus paranthracis]
MYRFRSIQSLLGQYKELENQEIYFANVESLNDPLEGKREYFWSGDNIVWTNLYKQYINCLVHVLLISKINPDKELEDKDILIFTRKEDHSELFQTHINEIYTRILNNEYIDKHLQFLSQKTEETHQNELYIFLKILHYIALEEIINVQTKFGLHPQSNSKNISFLKQVLAIHLDEIVKTYTLDPSLYYKYIGEFKDELNTAELEMHHHIRNINFINTEFTERYINVLKKLIYPECFVACFMDNCTNSSIWGYYGDSHKGVCLKFRTYTIDDGNHTIDLEKISGSSESSTSYDYFPHTFEKMNYSSQIQKIDFFRNLGVLPSPISLKNWYTDSNGKTSELANYLQEDVIKTWREEYWSKFFTPYLNKTSDWKNEREYRLLIYSALNTFDNPQNRKLKYKFEDLEAIIFGMNTPKEDQIKIIDIIKNKCKENNRPSFDFYKANSSNGNVEIKKLNININ